jgi:hypothetical protein
MRCGRGCSGMGCASTRMILPPAVRSCTAWEEGGGGRGRHSYNVVRVFGEVPSEGTLLHWRPTYLLHPPAAAAPPHPTSTHKILRHQPTQTYPGTTHRCAVARCLLVLLDRRLVDHGPGAHCHVVVLGEDPAVEVGGDVVANVPAGEWAGQSRVRSAAPSGSMAHQPHGPSSLPTLIAPS